MDHSGMTMTATSAAASATSTAMSGMDMGGKCKISMLWNWYTVDACFISSSWRITSRGMFAASCIGVILLVVCLELFRRLSKEYDALILRRFQQHVAAQIQQDDSVSASETNLLGREFVTFRATPLQQAIRSMLHAVTFGIAYIIMLLAMYYNGYIIISIFIGAGIGKFVCDWMVQTVPVSRGGRAGDVKVDERCEDPTVCCG